MDRELLKAMKAGKYRKFELHPSNFLYQSVTGSSSLGIHHNYVYSG
jgi:hypothetical protein